MTKTSFIHMDELTAKREREGALKALQLQFNGVTADIKKVKAANGKHKRKYSWCDACKRVVRYGGRHERRTHQTN